MNNTKPNASRAVPVPTLTEAQQARAVSPMAAALRAEIDHLETLCQIAGFEGRNTVDLSCALTDVRYTLIAYVVHGTDPIASLARETGYGPETDAHRWEAADYIGALVGTGADVRAHGDASDV